MPSQLQNLRRLRRSQHERRFSLLPKRDLDRATSLCDHCARPNCPYRTSGDRQIIVYAPVLDCKDYMAPLLFQKPDNLRDGVNTLRLGAAWARRLEKGDSIGLVSSVDHTLIGTAMVGCIESGTKSLILRNHASKNHLLVEKRLSGMKAQKAMEKILRNAYGNMPYDKAAMLTVVYLDNVNLCQGLSY